MKYKIAVAGAGIYGTSIALGLANAGHSVTLYDPLGVLRAASAINQFRIHSGYHYPRSSDTITELLESRKEFSDEFSEAIVQNIENYYAIPHNGSRTSPDNFEEKMGSFSLPLKPAKPCWVNFNFIDRCYQVSESIYDPNILRAVLQRRILAANIEFVEENFVNYKHKGYDFHVFATYGASGSHMHLFNDVRLQVVEKITMQLPDILQHKSLVVIDGPFTAFDPYGNTKLSQFGSALHTVHWQTNDPQEGVPEQYRNLLNNRELIATELTHFELMKEEASKVALLCSDAEYKGSRFTIRLVEHAPNSDRRVMKISDVKDHSIHVFSGKVVGAVKAAKIVLDKISNA